jgi:hypothetical protein
MQSLTKATAGQTFALIVGVALMKKNMAFQYAGRPPHVASTRAIKRAKRTHEEILASPSRCLGAWFDTQRSNRPSANKSFL